MTGPGFGTITHRANYEHIAFVLAEKLRLKDASRGIGDSFRVVKGKGDRRDGR